MQLYDNIMWCISEDVNNKINSKNNITNWDSCLCFEVFEMNTPICQK